MGDLLPGLRVVRAVARNVRGRVPPGQIDARGMTEDDMVQDLWASLWERHRRHGDGRSPAYYRVVLRSLAVDMARRGAVRRRMCEASRAEAGWWSECPRSPWEAYRAVEAREALVDLARVVRPEDLVAFVGAGQDSRGRVLWRERARVRAAAAAVGVL